MIELEKKQCPVANQIICRWTNHLNHSCDDLLSPVRLSVSTHGRRLMKLEGAKIHVRTERLYDTLCYKQFVYLHK